MLRLYNLFLFGALRHPRIGNKQMQAVNDLGRNLCEIWTGARETGMHESHFLFGIEYTQILKQI